MHAIDAIIVYEKQYLCREIITELELLEKGRHDDRGKKKYDTPEEDIRNIGAFRATSTANKLPMLFNTILQQQSYFFLLEIEMEV